mgnify:FL=1
MRVYSDKTGGGTNCTLRMGFFPHIGDNKSKIYPYPYKTTMFSVFTFGACGWGQGDTRRWWWIAIAFQSRVRKERSNISIPQFHHATPRHTTTHHNTTQHSTTSSSHHTTTHHNNITPHTTTSHHTTTHHNICATLQPEILESSFGCVYMFSTTEISGIIRELECVRCPFLPSFVRSFVFEQRKRKRSNVRRLSCDIVDCVAVIEGRYRPSPLLFNLAVDHAGMNDCKTVARWSFSPERRVRRTHHFRHCLKTFPVQHGFNA